VDGLAKRPKKGRDAVLAQAAMEYLMTYGWAILIIAVVLGVLFQLGVFSTSSFAPRAPPGACQIFRPNGPGTSQNINLMGVCTGQLPQYVAQFNGASGYITAGNPMSLRQGPPLTISAWIKTNAPVTVVAEILYHNQAAWTNGWEFNLQPGGYGSVVFEFANAVNNYDAIGASLPYSPEGQWFHVVAVITTTQKGMFINGVGGMVAGSGMATSSVTLAMGRASWGGRYFNGQIANMQIYNTSLSTSEIQSLYAEGIGGVPIIPQNVIGWWPLNGDAKDYSGNVNNGAASGISYANQWLGGYAVH
jgi:hypothetical protein